MDVDWPIEAGEFEVVDPAGCVAVCTLDDDVKVPKRGVAGVGKSRTENLGVERIVVNVISNPRIRALVVCGSEILGHMCGQAIIALHENGVDGRGRIEGAKGAIPFVKNIPPAFVERFREQVRVIDLVGVSDERRIAAEIAKIVAEKPSPFEGEPLDLRSYMIDEEEVVSDSLDLAEDEISIAPEYGLTVCLSDGRIRKP